MELSPTRGAYFEKIAFFASDLILDEIWREIESKRGAKNDSKNQLKNQCFFD